MPNLTSSLEQEKVQSRESLNVEQQDLSSSQPEVLNAEEEKTQLEQVEKRILADNREDIAEFVKEYQEEKNKRVDSDNVATKEVVIDGVKHQIITLENETKKINKTKVEEGQTWLLTVTTKIKKMWQAWVKQKKEEI